MTWILNPFTGQFVASGGATWYSQAGAPSNSVGINGDYDLNTTNGDVAEKVGGAWSIIGNIQGSPGIDSGEIDGGAPDTTYFAGTIDGGTP